MDKKLIGPSFQEIAKKHTNQVDYLAGKIKGGGVGVWGQIPMPAQALPEADARAIAVWIAKGASK
jgi:cytochrome c